MKYVYGWGAAVVIVGALFKILHWPGANIMLIVGLLTEAFIFFISVFLTAEGHIHSGIHILLLFLINQLPLSFGLTLAQLLQVTISPRGFIISEQFSDKLLEQ